MAFTQDGISYIGTDGRDSLVLTAGIGSWEFPTGGPAFIEALGENDQVTFNGNAADVTLVAGDGDDTTFIGTGGVTGQLSNSSINGNDGNDTITWLNLTNTSIYGGQGADTLQAFANAGGLTTNASEIQGNKGADLINLTGSITFSSVYGGADNDVINLTGGVNSFDNSIYGDKGNDVLNITIATGANNQVQGNAGDDVLNLSIGATANASAYGGSGDDVINAIGSAGTVFLSGDKGNDIVRGGVVGTTSNQILDGGDDRDILIYEGNANTTMIGGAGGDIFRINAIGGAAGSETFPFIEDFDSAEDNIEINIDLRTFSLSNQYMTGTFVGAPSLNGFFGATAQFGDLGIPLQATTVNFGAAGVLGARFLQVAFPSPITADYSYVASILSGQLTDGNLFKAANANQLLAGISAAAFIAVSAGNTPVAPPLAALGFTQDSRKLYAFTNIRITSAFTAMGAVNTFVTYNRFTLAQFATNNVNGSDIFLV